MRLMTLALAGLMTIGLTSCNDFSGEFRTSQKLKLKHTTIFGNTKTKKVPAGEYRATLGFSSKNKIKLSLKRSGAKDIDVKIKLPESRQFPNFEGPISIPASRTGQNYDIKGRIQTDITRSGMHHGYETCTYTDYVRRCERVCTERTRPNGDVVKECRRECRRVAVEIRGDRAVSYHYVYTNKRIKVGMFTPGSSQRLGDFRGQLNDTDKVYDHYGTCR